MSAQVRALVVNETRALLPTWIAAVLCASIAAVIGGDGRVFSLVALGVATVGLGAQSVGHEYTHRTLGVLLTLPAGRTRLLVVKMAVVGAMVLTLVAYAWMIGLLELWPETPPLPQLCVAATLCLAPALTMLCRSTLAGVVFSASLPPTLLVVMLLILHRMMGFPERAVFDLWSRALVPFFAAGALYGWWLFRRLEATEGGAAAIQLQWWSRESRAVAPTHPLWQLVKKELHLQQMTFVVTLLYLAGCLTTVTFGIPGISNEVSVVTALTAVYALGVPALAGSLATAEERQLGTLAWQLQLPTATWQQWTIKATIVFALALTLSIGIPHMLVPIWTGERPLIGTHVALAVMMTAVSMYVSSICATGVRAVVTSVVVVSALLWLVLATGLWIPRGSVAFLAAFGALLVAFACVNHRPETPSPARIWRQALSLAALVAFALAL